MERGERKYSKTRIRFKVRGHPYGVYTWSRRQRGGIVFRIGPLGHVQLQQYRCMPVGKEAANRRGKHGLTVHWWGVRGRRRKMGAEVAVFL